MPKLSADDYLALARTLIRAYGRCPESDWAIDMYVKMRLQKDRTQCG